MRVLILEDEPEDAIRIRNALYPLTISKYRVVDNDADYIRALNEPWDIILSDFNLPRYNALAALNELMIRRKPTPLIIVTGKLGPDSVATCKRLGAADVVFKSDLSKLSTIVVKVISEWMIR